ncbi:MAG: ATP-binding protein [Acidimicrobiales bacterium]
MKGLRPRLVATFAAVTAVTAGALAGASYLVVRDAVLDRAAESAIDEAQAVVAQVVASGQLPPGATPGDVRAAVSRVAAAALGDAHVVAVGADGTFDSTSVSLSASSVPRALLDVVLAGSELSWVRTGTGRNDHVVVGGQLPDGPQLFLFFPLADAVADLEVLRNVLAAAGAGLVVVSALVGVAAASGLLRPLRRARVAAHRLEVGLLQTRLPEEGRDEFTDLARAFNRMADALERTVGDLRSLEASHRRFVSDVSHELRTPLTALTTAADVLDDNTGGLNDAGRRAARLLVVESRRLASMVEDLMEISRFDAGVPAMAWEPVDVGRLVVGALEARGWGGKVEVDAPPGGVATTWADPRRVDAVVANLVGNALRHGAPPVRVEVTVPAGAQLVDVTVSDAGAGIPAEHLAHLFDRFYKADPSRSSGGGSGLGLAIARENARLHGGDVSVVSERGLGTRFTFTLPRRTAAPADGEVPPPVAERLPAGDVAETTARHDVFVNKVIVNKPRRGR